MQATQKNLKNLSIQPGFRGSNDLHVGRKMATFQLFFQSGRAKDLSAVQQDIANVQLKFALPLTQPINIGSTIILGLRQGT